MRVAVLVGEVTGRGGMETVLTSVIKAFNTENDGEMKLFLLGGSKDEQWLSKLNGNQYFLLNDFNEPKSKRYLKCLTKAPKEIKEFDPDIILAADEKSVLYAKIISPYLKRKPKIGSWIHFSLTSIKPIYQRAVKMADFHLAISDGLKKEFIEAGLSHESNVHLIYNPINTNQPLVERPQETAHFIYIGRLIYDGQKRVNDLLNALSRLDEDWKLTIAGDGTDREKLKQLARELGIDDKICWLGWQKNPWNNIHEATALVLTSEYEGLGMVLLEAMSRGITCISSDCPVGPSNIIRNNDNGWLYPLGDIEALIGLLNNVVTKQVSLPSQEKVKNTVNKYDTKFYIRNLRNVFEKII